METALLMNRLRYKALARAKKLKEEFELRGIKMENEGKGVVKIGGEDAYTVTTAFEVLSAFNRGFSEEDALLLFNQDYEFLTINIKDYANSKNRIIQLKGRVIGRNGKIKELIESRTNTKICIFGKTISIIGEYESVDKAARIINAILEGKQFSTAFKLLSYG
jgi:ribosomal RNA assembly protein